MADPRSASLLTQSQTPASPVAPGYGPSAQRPVNPKKGTLFWDTTINREVVYTEGGWQIIGQQPAAMVGFGTTAQRPSSPPPGFIYFDTTLIAQFTWTGADFVRTSPSTPAAAMVGAGITAARPTNPLFGFLYHDTTLGQEIAWNSQAWIVIGPGLVSSGPPIPPPTPGPSTPAPVIFSSNTLVGGVGTLLSYQIQATNSPTSFSCDSTVALAAIGLSFNTSTGLLTGTPTGTYSGSVTFGATNSSGTGTLPVSVTVNAAPVTSGRWSSATGLCFAYPAYPAILGATVANSTPSLLTFLLTAESGALPPGVTWQCFDPNSTLLGSATTVGGEATAGGGFNINLGGGYTVVISTVSSAVKIRPVFTISGGSLLSNSSVRATAVRTNITGDSTSGVLTLTLTGISPATTIASAMSYYLVDGVPSADYLQAPYATWNFGGDTTNNPKTNFSPGLSNLTLTVNNQGTPSAPAAGVADVIVSVDG